MVAQLEATSDLVQRSGWFWIGYLGSATELPGPAAPQPLNDNCDPLLHLQERLAEMIESNPRRGGFALPVPLPMAAACSAHGQVATFEYWLAGHGACSAAKLAAAFRSGR
jgi:hypothetical protein